MQELGAIIVIALLAFVAFVIYFIFKILQFVIQAINLYKDIVTRQDVMIKLLKDLRQGASAGAKKSSQAVFNDDERSVFCTNCGAKLDPGQTECASCKRGM